MAATDREMAATDREELVEDQRLKMAVDIVTAYLSNNPLPAATIPDLISTVHGALANLSRPAEEASQTNRKPAVPIRRSVTPDYIVCLEDGKQLKMLKRYLRSNYGMTPAEYRAKWGLPADYPMVAPNYAKQRSEFAKQIGLGRSAKRKAPRRKSK
jgi:predicted transcriptional regulator